jgi:hypothetical protein
MNQWIPRVQQCEMRLSELEQQLKDMEAATQYLRREANHNITIGANCATAMCRISRQLNDALRLPASSAIPLIRVIAQDLDQQCIGFERHSSNALMQKDNRRVEIRRAQRRARRAETALRIGEAPGGDL